MLMGFCVFKENILTVEYISFSVKLNKTLAVLLVDVQQHV